MFAPTDPESSGMPFRLDNRMIAAAAIVILIGGVALAWIGGQLGPPFPDPGMVIGFTLVIVMILVCCSSILEKWRFVSRREWSSITTKNGKQL
jgi:hypothetical protein